MTLCQPFLEAFRSNRCIELPSLIMSTKCYLYVYTTTTTITRFTDRDNFIQRDHLQSMH